MIQPPPPPGGAPPDGGIYPPPLPQVPAAHLPVWNVPYQGPTPDYPTQPQPREEPSNAKLMSGHGGQCSMDPSLNNVEDIMHFFRTYNTRPLAGIHCKGSETYTTRDSDGHTKSHTRVDFDYKVWLTDFIIPYVAHKSSFTYDGGVVPKGRGCAH